MHAGFVDAAYLGINTTPDESVWELPVTDKVTGGKGQLFGGCAVGAAASLLESVTARPVAWVGCQFVGSARPDDTITLSAQIVAQGRSITQAVVHGTIDGQPQSTVLAALGTKAFPDDSPSRPMPKLAGPDQCERLDFDPGQGGLNERVDIRSVDPQTSTPRTTSRFWFRFAGATSGDVLSVSVAADFFPPSLSAAIGRRVFGASLDNTIRFIDRAECDWLLIEMTVDSVHNGIAHGTSHIWAENGQLAAIASQTCAVSEF